jgi:ectoine hydroxylase-related dioxygenase (phytanoyl-CoA dioxygenase family)
MDPQKARAAYDAQGYVYIPGALAGDLLKQVQAAFDRAAEKKELQDLLHQDDLFLDLVDHPAWFPVVRAVVGDDVQLRYIRGGIVQPNTDSGSGWHCDLSGLNGVYLPDSVIMTKLFVYLKDVPENGSCLALVAGSHRYDLGHPLPDIDAHEAMSHHTKMIVKAGDAVLMNGYTWHARFHNRSDTPRQVIESSYIHTWMKTQYQFEDFSPHLQKRILACHNRRQLFGAPVPEATNDQTTDWQRRLEDCPPYRPVEVGI